MQKKKGVGLIVYCRQTGRLLVMEELEDKPSIQKKAGMFSFPLETVEEGETRGQTSVRLTREEIGVDIEPPHIFFGGAFEIIPTATTFAAYALCDEEFDAYPQDTDIAYHGWMSPEDLRALPLEKRRVEVEPVLKFFVEQVLPSISLQACANQ